MSEMRSLRKLSGEGQIQCQASSLSGGAQNFSQGLTQAKAHMQASFTVSLEDQIQDSVPNPFEKKRKRALDRFAVFNSR